LNKKTCIILSEKKWNNNLVNKLKKKSDNIEWIKIDVKNDFNYDSLLKIKPNKIFIPHWSYIIPEKIYNNFECIVFHMTDLPYGRGGSPLQNLIIRGHKHTKISAIKVVKELDAGPIYLKKDLLLKGSAQEIFDLANEVVKDMIIEIVKTKPVPIKQEGKPTLFKRRKPSMSNMNDLESLDEVYDFIRMLDADGYPHAFLETEKLKFEFTDANFKNKNEIIATVKIKMKIK